MTEYTLPVIFESKNYLIVELDTSLTQDFYKTHGKNPKHVKIRGEISWD